MNAKELIQHLRDNNTAVLDSLNTNKYYSFGKCPCNRASCNQATVYLETLPVLAPQDLVTIESILNGHNITGIHIERRNEYKTIEGATLVVAGNDSRDFYFCARLTK